MGAVLIDGASEGIDDGRYDKLGASLGLDVGVSVGLLTKTGMSIISSLNTNKIELKSDQ